MIITCGSLVPYGSSRDITREHPLHINGPLILYVTERKRLKRIEIDFLRLYLVYTNITISIGSNSLLFLNIEKFYLINQI